MEVLVPPSRLKRGFNGRNCRRAGPTMKLKRPSVLKIYKEEIDDFYKEVATPDDPLPPQ